MIEPFVFLVMRSPAGHIRQMFVDEVTVSLRSGSGGNGVIAFRREKFVPRGGPSGGDGGKGGDVVLLPDGRLTTLVDLRYKREYKAGRGGDGGPNNMTGRNGEDLVLKLPVGTQVYDTDTDALIADLMAEGEAFVIARGGRGGRGNQHFATSTQQAPRIAENGEPGEELHVRLELKLLADVGLIGFPNVGKSTLIAQVSSARPRIADYPFTTLVPNLGVVRVDEERSYVMADIPGLIEGAHAGAGLGDRFLRHIERTRLLLHIIDVSGCTGRDPSEDFDAINRELALYSPVLADLPQVVALNKLDVPGARKIAGPLARSLESRGMRVFEVSAATGQGVKPVVYHLMERLAEMERGVPVASESDQVVRIAPRRQDESRFEAERVGEREFVVRGKGIVRMVAMSNLDSDEAVRRLHRKLVRLGVIKRLEELGAARGDTVRIGEIEFDYASENEVE